MRVVLSGGTGFLGTHVARRLRERNYEVIALVRPTSNTRKLLDFGCKVQPIDLEDTASVQEVLESSDALMHIAGNYAVGINESDRPAMMRANFHSTRSVMDAAVNAGIGRIVYASSIITYGNTQGRIVDETYERDLSLGFLSCYDESKYLAHNYVASKVAEGAPIITICPGSLYGPNDHSEVGRQMLQAATGKLPALMLVDVGLTMVHVEDCADGFMRAFEAGEVGETYNLGGAVMRLRDALETSADIAGRHLTRQRVPTKVLKAIAPAAPRILPLLGYPPNLRELIATADNVTYWADDTKARKALGWRTRSFEQGVRETLKASGIIS